jgi:molybdenum cofactor cytidylyltransferase
VGFAAELYPELTSLAGDEGARRIIARSPAYPVELDDAGILVDIDTEDDLTELRRTINAARRDPGASAPAPL